MNRIEDFIMTKSRSITLSEGVVVEDPRGAGAAVRDGVFRDEKSMRKVKYHPFRVC